MELQSGKVKQCKHCEITKSITEFHKLPHAKYGVSHICKCCNKIQASKNYQKNKDYIKVKSKNWASNNREKRRVIVNRYDHKTIDRKRKRSSENNKLKRVLNPELERAKGVHYAHVRRTRMLAADTGVSPLQLKEVIEKANGVCAYCQQKAKITIDHFIPVSKGGLHSIDNIVPCCRSCNSRKRHSEAIGWLVNTGFLENYLSWKNK